MAYLACATFPDTDHVRDAIMALDQYGVPSDRCSVLWLQAPQPTDRDRDLAGAAAALAPVAVHATADGPVGAAGTLDPPLGHGAAPERGWLARLLVAEGVPADEAAEIERRVLAGEVLLTVRAKAHTAALEQLLGWTGAFRFRPMDLFAPDAPEELGPAGQSHQLPG